ncbi:MAG TPA: cation:proton antiporter, partial [Minicystis sp.]|nr:cation:proton antiporter [Minicystis sp.]
MSHAPKQAAGFNRRVTQVLALVALFAFAAWVSRATHANPAAATVGAVGFLLLAGMLAADLFDVVGLPHLSGQLCAGIVAGPHVLAVIDEASARQLTGVNALALALIALEGGAELRISGLRDGFKSLAWATVMQTVPVALCVGAAFALARPLMPFLDGLELRAVVGAGLLWGVVAMTRSPSAALGILSQTRAKGPVARFTLNYVMASDIVVVALMAIAIMLVRPLVDPAGSFSAKELKTLG